MSGAEGVVFALAAARKTGDAAPLPELRHPLTAAGQDFMSVALMADVPNQAIPRRIEHVV